jgi:hypothetical protein
VKKIILATIMFSMLLPMANESFARGGGGRSSGRSGFSSSRGLFGGGLFSGNSSRSSGYGYTKKNPSYSRRKSRYSNDIGAAALGVAALGAAALGTQKILEDETKEQGYSESPSTYGETRTYTINKLGQEVEVNNTEERFDELFNEIEKKIVSPSSKVETISPSIAPASKEAPSIMYCWLLMLFVALLLLVIESFSNSSKK